MITIQDIYNNNIQLFTKQFPGGETLLRLENLTSHPMLEVTLNYESDTDIINLAMLNDAVRRAKGGITTLNIPYFPAARQDRVCNKGEALSVKVYAQLINNMHIPEVVVFDPHSDAVGVALENVTIVKNHKFAQNVLDHVLTNGVDKEDVLLVSHDAGSNKKIFEISQLTGVPNIRADKLREISTGKIIETIVYADDLTGKIMVILDDISSYGGTFMALSKKLKEKGAEKVFLAVSHWEGVADLNKLKESGIEKVYTTNSRVFENPDKQITVFPWNQ